jgi:hypothetical protein
MRIKRQLICKPDGSRFLGDEIHLRQGDMDGACGPYCLAMAMIGLGLSTREEITDAKYHGNSKIAKLIRTIELFRGEYFFRNGTDREHLNDAIRLAFDRDVELLYQKKGLRGKHFRDYMNIFVKDDADLVWPVILGIDFGKNAECGHWVLVVGYEHNPDGQSCYLVLDPGAEKPRQNECWNARLEEKGTGSPLPYIMTPNQGDSYRVGIFDALGFVPRQ